MNRLHCIPFLVALSFLPACGKEQNPAKTGSSAKPEVKQGEPPKQGETPTKEATQGARPKREGPAAGTISKPPSFARWVSTGETEGYYQTAVAHYEDAQGRSVDLIGAVHIGDRAYFEALNKLFTKYQALLYELVAKKGTIPAKKHKSSSPISMLQRFMTQALDLRFQLDGIDYKAKNFVHADLSPEGFAKKLKEKGLTFTTMMLKVMLRGMQQAQEGKGPQITIFHILAGALSEDGPRYFKFLFAQQLGNLEQMLANFGGKKGEKSVIIGERNRVAFKVLDQQLKEGKSRLGIYYGAAHLPYMHDLLGERGFHYVSSTWLTAWDCRLSPEQRARYKALRAKKAARRKAILEKRRRGKKSSARSRADKAK
ncbi:MAG TPA: hypothetical protein ENK02_07935 [Planctomycetes bacterium]|nr:hypothetical protein [Planctomycetota bacterium]